MQFPAIGQIHGFFMQKTLFSFGQQKNIGFYRLKGGSDLIPEIHGYLMGNIIPETVAMSGTLRTFSDERRFFSYRRATHRGEKDYGRLISAIALT
jgi:hypothetical protein